MRTKCIAAVAAVGVALVISTSLFAHHAGSMYDRKNPVTLAGIVTNYLFVNPHTQIHFEVTDEKGNVTGWVAESAPALRLSRTGWNTESLKPGDHISVTGAPHKDRRQEMMVIKLVGPAGQVLSEPLE